MPTYESPRGLSWFVFYLLNLVLKHATNHIQKRYQTVENRTMKQLLILVTILSILSSCNQKKSKKTQSELKVETETGLKKIDTTVVYAQTDFDTISSSQKIMIGNYEHQLEIKSYSLNDSSIININRNNKDIYHNYNFEIILKRFKDTVLKSELHKVNFKDSLNKEFYKKCILLGIEYDGIRSNRLFFKGGFFVPNTDWEFGNEFAIFYQTEKKNQINSWNYKEIE